MKGENNQILLIITAGLEGMLAVPEDSLKVFSPGYFED